MVSASTAVVFVGSALVPLLLPMLFLLFSYLLFPFAFCIAICYFISWFSVVCPRIFHCSLILSPLSATRSFAPCHWDTQVFCVIVVSVSGCSTIFLDSVVLCDCCHRFLLQHLLALPLFPVTLFHTASAFQALLLWFRVFLFNFLIAFHAWSR